MIRVRIAIALAAVLTAGLAQAQVAAPELAPVAPRYYRADAPGFNSANVTPDNPAALLWSKTSRAGAGGIRLEQENVGGGRTVHDGYFFGYRGIERRFAFAVEHVAVDEDPEGFRETASSAQLALPAVEGLAVGGGVDRARTDAGAGSTRYEGRTLGLSLSVQPWLFLGYGIGRERFDSGAGMAGGRDTTLLGVALRPKGRWQWHLAYDRLDKDNFDSTRAGGFDATTTTAQVLAGDVLLGVQRVVLESKSGDPRFTARVLDAGWAPERGLSVTARLSAGEETAGATTLARDSVSLAVGYTW